jgi:hypothetical protein
MLAKMNLAFKALVLLNKFVPELFIKRGEALLEELRRKSLIGLHLKLIFKLQYYGHYNLATTFQFESSESISPL